MPRAVTLATLAAGALLAVLILIAHEPQALCLLPLAALGLAMLARRYPGERILAALRERRPPVRRTTSVRLPRSPEHLVPRGGLLIASALAVRPPPAVAAAR